MCTHTGMLGTGMSDGHNFASLTAQKRILTVQASMSTNGKTGEVRHPILDISPMREGLWPTLPSDQQFLMLFYLFYFIYDE